MSNRNKYRKSRTPMLNIQYDLSRNFIHHERPSLKQIAVRKFSLSVWDSFITELPSSQCSSDSFRKYFTEVVEKANNEIKSTSLLKYCKETLIEMNFELFLFLCKLEDALQLNHSSDREKLYFRNIKWTSQCTVDRPSSALSILENSDASSVDKFKLASYFCLKDQVSLLLKQFPNVMKTLRKDDDFPIMHFWEFHAKNKDNEFFNIASRLIDPSIGSYEELLDYAIEHENEVAVYYIWENFMTNKQKDFIDYIDDAMLFNCPNNIVVYLLTQVTRPEDIEDICMETGYEILEKLYDDNKFHIYFMELAKHVLPHIRHIPFIKALIILILCWQKDASEREKYERLVKELACRHRSDIKFDFIFSSKTIIDLLVSAKNKFWDLGKEYEDEKDNEEEEKEMRKAEESVKKILSIGSVEDARKFLNSTSGMKACMDFLENSPEELVKFIDEMLPKEISAQYKRKFLEEKGIELCYNAIKEDNSFINFDPVIEAFCEDRVEEYMKSLPYQQQGKIIGDILRETTHSDPDWMKRVDIFLNWCYDRDKTEIYNCKIVLFDPEVDTYHYCCQIFVNQLCRLVKLKNHNRAEKYLKWAFEREENISQYKKKVASEMQKPKSDRNLKVDFNYYEKQRELFTSFFH